MISNRCARKSLLINCNSIISKNYLRFLVDNNDVFYQLAYIIYWHSDTSKIYKIKKELKP